MKHHLDERVLRLWAGAEALAYGRGGRELVARATGLGRNTVLDGKKEVRSKKPPKDLVRVRRKGAGGKPIEVRQPGIHEALESLVDPVTRGDPESPLRWTCKSTRKLSAEMKAQGFTVSQHKVAEMLRERGYSLQATQKVYEGEQHLGTRSSNTSAIRCSGFLPTVSRSSRSTRRRKSSSESSPIEAASGSRPARRYSPTSTTSRIWRSGRQCHTASTTWGGTRPGSRSASTTTRRFSR